MLEAPADTHYVGAKQAALEADARYQKAIKEKKTPLPTLTPAQ